MNGTSDQEERLESVKAGTVAAFSLFLAFISTTFINNRVLAKYLQVLSILGDNTVNLHWVEGGAIAVICGFLFGVTYRYIIRGDRNPQLKAGAVLTFGLVRGLAQLDVGLNCPGPVWPFVVLGLESILWFAIAANAVDWAMQLGWIKPFTSG